MKNKFTALIVAFFLAAVPATHAQTTLTAWTFDNLATGLNSSPQRSTGLGTASALGLGNSFNSTNSISNPDVQSLAGSSSGGPNCWRIRGYNAVAARAAETAGQRTRPSARRGPNLQAAPLVTMVS